MRARFLGVAVALLCAGGCEALVGDSLPSTINCIGSLPGTCPDGQQCTNSTCQPCPGGHCGPIFIKDAGVDVFVPHDTGHDVGVDHFVIETGTKDTGIDVGVPPGLGDTCSSSGLACASGLFCLDAQDLLGLNFPSGTSICSATCCSDADCGGSGICYPTSGGNYCLSAALASNKCGDMGCGTACCTSTRGCSGQDNCGLTEGSGAGAAGPQCASFGNGTPPDSCGQDSDCSNGICLNPPEASNCDDGCSCADAVDCCGPTDCNTGDTCNWLEGMDPTGNTLVFRGCQAPGGHLKANASCATDPTGCEGSICANFAGSDVCTQPCCQDADCQATDAISSWVCRPYNVPINGGMTELLVCQPPSSTES